MKKGGLRYIFIHPDDITGKQIKDFKLVAASGGESFMEDFEYKILHTVELICLCYSGNQIVGVRALKTPSSEKVRDYMLRANRLDLTFKYELGYAAVLPEAQGQGIYKKMTEGMLEYIKEPVYIVTRSENKSVIKTMNKFGFVRVGDEFESSVNLGRKLIVMIKNCSMV